MTPTVRVLLVDDDEAALAAHQRFISAFAEVHTALSGQAALNVLAEHGPFGVAVVEIAVSDMPGPGLLEELRKRSPETIRVVVTAIDDLASAIEVFNSCGVFRYLTKPCKPAAFVAAVREAVAQAQRQIAEREVREQIFDGIVQLLTGEITSVEPELSAATQKLKERARQLAQVVRLPVTADLETASELMRLGIAGIPRHVQEKIQAHEPLAPEEMRRLARIPEIGARVVDHIARLSGVREIIRYEDAAKDAPKPAGRQEIPLAARILRALVDLQILEESGLNTAAALLRLRQDAAKYDRSVLKAMDALYSDPKVLAGAALEECMVENLVSGMILATDALSTEGVSLVAAGTSLSLGLIEHLRNFAELGEVVQPIIVLRQSVPPEAAEAAGSAPDAPADRASPEPPAPPGAAGPPTAPAPTG